VPPGRCGPDEKGRSSASGSTDGKAAVSLPGEVPKEHDGLRYRQNRKIGKGVARRAARGKNRGSGGTSKGGLPWFLDSREEKASTTFLPYLPGRRTSPPVEPRGGKNNSGTGHGGKKRAPSHPIKKKKKDSSRCGATRRTTRCYRQRKGNADKDGLSSGKRPTYPTHMVTKKKNRSRSKENKKKEGRYCLRKERKPRNRTVVKRKNCGLGPFPLR